MNGKIMLVGIGPGQPEMITPQAREAIGRAGVIIGHPDTLALIAMLTQGKELLAVTSNPLERSRLALEKAQTGATAAIVSNGDPGIYAIAATFFGYLKEHNLSADVEVVPGINLALYAAARIGAPLGGDFAAISLTDQCAPWETIQKRITSAAEADFVIALFNPLGRLGPERLKEALAIIGRFRRPNTPAGLLSQAATHNENILITTMAQIETEKLAADTLIIIGNSQTYTLDGRMVTPRPYLPGAGY
ncbi:MAG: precorrin-3B C(17)-methyltransferase [Dehalococcoidia bacterium]|nr:precorrin-3B C(17)-methyltransferase [Dehalococcoidia bacterium]